MRANDIGHAEDHRGSKTVGDDLMALETARAHLVERVLIARGDECVGVVLGRIPGQAFDAVDAIYVVDDRCAQFADLFHGRSTFPLGLGFYSLVHPAAPMAAGDLNGRVERTAAAFMRL
jgi:hypothetical protein